MSIARWTEEELAAHLREKSLRTVPREVIASDKPAEPQPIARGRQPNKLESAYALELKWQHQQGLIEWYRYEAVTLKLGFDTRFTPDYMVQPSGSSRPRFDEVKGPHMFEDARVKLMAAATMFPMFDFYLVRRATDGGWHCTEIRR